mmetsp:Transcript_7876/g.18829  ORF Transcript_7876/g.18829 Transcript_7876/m.18829 type:complete len:672 (+) Transcript_7876:71-2086(+)
MVQTTFLGGMANSKSSIASSLHDTMPSSAQGFAATHKKALKDKKFNSKDLQDFSRYRWRLYSLVISSPWEMLVSFIICCNFIIIIFEANAGVACGDSVIGCMPVWLSVCNYIFVGFYTVESFIMLFVYRRRMCRDWWMIFDIMIVIVAWVDVIVSTLLTTAGLQEVQLLRLFRIARLARAARIVHMSPELHAMITGIISALTTVFWGLIMVMLLLAVWAVLAVELLHGSAHRVHGNNDLCLSAFDSVFSIMLMFFQTLMAGDSWGDCAVPMIQDQPWAIIIFGGSLLTVQLGFANLVLAVIVERARQAHEEEQRQNLNEQVKKRRDAEKRLLDMCKAIDVDQDGILTLEELMDAYVENEDFRKTLTLLEIDETDLLCLFDLMDADRSGDLTYEEMISCIHKSETNDLKRQMMMVKLQVQDIWLRIRDTFLTQQEDIIREFKGEMTKPSLFDSRTYLIRKLTGENATSLLRRTRTMQSRISEAYERAQSMRQASQTLAAAQAAPPPVMGELQTEAGTELSAPVFAIRQLRHHINAELQRTQNWIDFEVQRFISHQFAPAPDDAKEVAKDGAPKDKDMNFKDGSGKDSPRTAKSHSPRTSKSTSPRMSPRRREEKQVTKPNVPPVNLKDAQNWQNAQNQWGIHDGEDVMLTGNLCTPTGQVRLSPRQVTPSRR